MHRFLQRGGGEATLDIGAPDGSLQGADVRWTAEGARPVLGGGHETFVPADASTGGR